MPLLLLLFSRTSATTTMMAASSSLQTRPLTRTAVAPQVSGGDSPLSLALGHLRGGSTSSSSSSSPNPHSYRFRPSPQTSSSWQHGSSSSTSTTANVPQTTTKQAIDAFLTRDSRVTFIARVYAILTGQLLITALSIFLFAGLRPPWMYGRRMGVVCGLSLVVSTVAWLVMGLSETARRSSRKWLWLALFTLGEAMAVGLVSSAYAFRTVLSAMLATGTATLVITLYTLLQRNPQYDLSQWGAGLSSFAVLFLLYGLVQWLQLLGILPEGFLPFSEAAYGLLGATLFSFYLAHHTRLIVSGKHTKYQMNDKDYVFGAMALYNDIVQIFLYLLRLLASDE